MNIASQLAILAQIYKIYAEFTARLDLACKKTCAWCCTSDVTLTTLEGVMILNRLARAPCPGLLRRIRSQSDVQRFQPQTTTNQLAEFCAAGVAPPDEPNKPHGSACLLLTGRLCPIYAVRPFGCRCLISRQDCGTKGYAEIDDFVLSVNTVFLQTIEHVDAKGCSGNLIDVLNALSRAENRAAYENNRRMGPHVGLIANHPLTVLMIPPEHRTRMEPLLQSLRRIKI